jgi:anti-anti-sigma factor
MRNLEHAVPGRVETELEDGERPRIRLRGECDISTVPELEAHVGRQLSWGQYHLLFDLTEATFVDSSILRILLGAHRQATAQGGEVVLLCGPGFVRRLLFLLEIDRIVRVCAPEDWRETASTVN